MTVVFDYGESRHIKLRICSCKNEDFEIISASYELTKKGNDKPEDSGGCVLYGHVIDISINPKERGTYLLKITYYIADETLIENLEVRVI